MRRGAVFTASRGNVARGKLWTSHNDLCSSAAVNFECLSSKCVERPERIRLRANQRDVSSTPWKTYTARFLPRAGSEGGKQNGFRLDCGLAARATL